MARGARGDRGAPSGEHTRLCRLDEDPSFVDPARNAPGTKRTGGQVIAENDEPSVTGTAGADLMVQCPGTTPTGGGARTELADCERILPEQAEKTRSPRSGELPNNGDAIMS
jgi:hypothetical protein